MARAASGPGSTELRGSPKSVPKAPSSPWERGLVGLTQLCGGGEGPSQDWRRNCFLLCVCLGWENGKLEVNPGWQAPHVAEPWAARLAPLPGHDAATV